MFFDQVVVMQLGGSWCRSSDAAERIDGSLQNLRLLLANDQANRRALLPSPWVAMLLDVCNVCLPVYYGLLITED